VELNIDAAAAAEKNTDKVLAGDIHQLADTLPEAYFDCVVFNDTLEHLVDPFGVLLKIRDPWNQFII
jgi:2-polyprenyl-3-methyl-5-hydroxy-6-metoxy-1,4-benzoquinol methylase